MTDPAGSGGRRAPQEGPQLRGVWCVLGVCVRRRVHGRAGRCRGEAELADRARMRGEGRAGHPIQAGVRGASPGANPPVETGRGLSLGWGEGRGHKGGGAEAPSRSLDWRGTWCLTLGAGGRDGQRGRRRRAEEEGGLEQSGGPGAAGWAV